MIRGMFSQYVPKKVVAELIDNPDLMSLGGERRRMTVLFTDVAGFTSVSEKLTPDELVHLLNEYLSEMSKIILDNEGIIDKYEGDLIMAEWGAPVFFEDMRFTLTGQNLFVITNFTGFDPEVNVDKNIDDIPSYGIEYTPYPSARTFTLGVYLAF